MQSLALASPARHPRFMTSDDASEMALLGAALAALRRSRGLSQAEAGNQFGIAGQAWGKYENGKAPSIFHPDTQRKLTAAIGTTVEELARERDRLALLSPGGRARAILEASASRASQVHRANDEGLPIRDRVQAGAWLEADDVAQAPRGFYNALPDPRFAFADQWMDEVIGDSMDRRRIFESDLVQVVDAVAINYQFRTGDVVEVERLRFDGSERELTIKEVEVTGDGVLLWPRSNNVRWQQPLRLDDGAENSEIEVRVRGLVIASVRRLFA